MDEFVRRPVRRTQTNTSRSIPRRPNVARADAGGIPVVKAPPETNHDKEPTTSSKKPDKKFNFKLPTPKTKKQWIIFGVIAAILLSSACFAVYWFVIRDTSPKPVASVVPEPEPEPEPTTAQSPVSGREVPLNKMDQPIYSVQIENSPEARPQSGLVDADIVTEAIAEGGITRFNAIYHDKTPASIGPIRSMRPYFIDFFLPYNAGAVHAGGSPEALNDISRLGIQDMDHDTINFHRVSSRYAPHNLYTSGKQMTALFKSRNYKNGKFTSLTRAAIDESESIETPGTDSESTPAANPKAKNINLNISRSLYNVSYAWDSKTNSYPRTMAGASHNDGESGKRISPDVIVVPVVSKRNHPDGVHIIYDTVGSGTLFVFQNGEVIKGTWKKPSRSAQWQLLDSKNKPIELNPGQTWFNIIESAGRVTYTP